ncbi:rho GTPase-activating protein 6-like [Hydractinia symbiolongicarpus]|uniref:rho GTPase-activating protein 6-like n=1 Tax=Hydractinia symbiolongicarpus TaxID=13093 RepID=UPI0025508D36|nr:rho GTPase-activating protein 6-like [Hydractinia symbiolongicarpus]XP_057313022.1 rho GTPase-activating protein 6-like [Hydractinia symbiolongicarpus]
MVVDVGRTVDRNIFRRNISDEDSVYEDLPMSSSVGRRNLLRLNIDTSVKRNSDIMRQSEEKLCSKEKDDKSETFETDVNRNSIVDKPICITPEDICEVTSTEITERKIRKKNSAINSFRSLVKATVISSELNKTSQNQDSGSKTSPVTKARSADDNKKEIKISNKKKISTSSRDKKLRKKRNRRSRAIPNEGASLWAPIDNCCWKSAGGRTVNLEDISLAQLCDAERRALKKLAILRLHELGADCQVTIPKEHHAAARRRWKQILTIKSKKVKGDANEKASAKPTNPVFCIELFQVIENDKAVEKAHQAVMEKLDMVGEEIEEEGEEEVKGLDLKQDELNNDLPNSGMFERRNSDPILFSNRGSLFNTKTEGDDAEVSNYMLNALRTIDTLKEEDEEEIAISKRKSRLIEALTLSSTSASSMCILDREIEFKAPAPQVPKVITQTVDYITKYALNTIGIFRTGGSKKRVRQMKEDYDSGHSCVITEDTNPHDVAALLKDFLRCLPDPLLTRELYPAFLSCAKNQKRKIMLDIVKPLIWLLPVPNRDTLKLTLHCLQMVADNALDRKDEDGNLIPGNKMDSQNLATLMAPNILHRCKTYKNPQAFQVDGSLNSDDNKCSIEVVEAMISNNENLFEISANDHHAVLSILLEEDPETVDYVLRRKSTRTSLVEAIEGMEEEICITANVNGKRPSSAGPRTVYNHEEVTFRKSNSFNQGPYKPFVRRRKDSTGSRPTSTKSDPDRNSLRRSGMGTPPHRIRRKSSKVFAELGDGEEALKRNSESPRDSGVVIAASTPPFQRNSLRNSLETRIGKSLSDSPTITKIPLIVRRQQSRDRDSRDSAYDSGMQGMFSNRNTTTSIQIITDEEGDNLDIDLTSSPSDVGSPKSPFYLSDVLDTPSFVSPEMHSPNTVMRRKISLPAFAATERPTGRATSKSMSIDGEKCCRPSLSSTKTNSPIDWNNEDNWPNWEMNPRESQFPTQETTL